MREHGQFKPKITTGRPRTDANNDLDEELVRYTLENPEISTREIASNFSTNQSHVWRALNENAIHPFHLQNAQGLLESDYVTRMDFCNWLDQMIIRKQDFTNQILFTDESTFDRNGFINFHNIHYSYVHTIHSSFIDFKSSKMY